MVPKFFFESIGSVLGFPELGNIVFLSFTSGLAQLDALLLLCLHCQAHLTHLLELILQRHYIEIALAECLLASAALLQELLYFPAQVLGLGLCGLEGVKVIFDALLEGGVGLLEVLVLLLEGLRLLLLLAQVKLAEFEL